MRDHELPVMTIDLDHPPVDPPEGCKDPVKIVYARGVPNLHLLPELAGSLLHVSPL